ncbi:hypothetical protein IC762_17870 [Bradyrhizobium genosp. L]|uniref:hypothetical protein n=1 Tax=Bradyrhizobium genosp. L TaxID=83637 RepID=UPI0018A26AFD|nr:hypothetical protein [Bradyrhizobium genosp. L]QPF81691.1 hypothetical protein IC762_17870 [Bradyrhizobium genosp. L]
MIRIRFVDGVDAVAAGIRAACYGFWAIHTEAVMPDGTLLGAHYKGGVQARAGDYDVGQYTKDIIVEIPVEQALADKFHAFMRAQLGKPYDIEAIAALALNREWQEPEAWFCSELVAAALVDCGWFTYRLATEFNKITPRDLLLIVSGRINVN